MSQMLVDIKRIVTDDVSSRISQYEVMHEAVTNAIHANATRITCDLESFDNLLTENGEELTLRKVDNIVITDNGDGLNDENYKSFCKYRTEHKQALGCKGVGRFIFLKVYKDVCYKSLLYKEQEERTFVFNFDFDTDNLSKSKAEVSQNLTEILFSKVTLPYLDSSKGIDRRIELDLEKIKSNILVHLIPTLFFYKKKGVSIQIDIKDKKAGAAVSITPEDVPDFIEKKFYVYDRDQKQHQFVLHHHIIHGDSPFFAFYCGDNRTVCEFSDQDFKLTMPAEYAGFLLVESEYLDKHVNNERNNFGIYPVRTDVYSTISWEMINNELKKILSDLIQQDIPEAKSMNTEKLKEIQDERPYLIEYIEEADIDMAGFLDKKTIIDKAKKRFDSAKERFLSSTGKPDYTEKELNEAIQITQNELVSYIYDRVQVIERLQSLIDKQENVEAIIHNLFMQKYTEDDYNNIGKNNLWLLDDRFTSYSYAASDKRIKDVLKQLGEELGEIENGDDKPDLSLFFSHSPANPKSLKSVLIEIKPFDYKAKPDRKKFQGVQQLVDYVKAFKTKENVEEIWAYLITDVDTKLAERLRGDDYTPLFSTAAPIYHRFYKELGISIYIIDAKTLIKDAESRNKTFLDIIRKKSKLNDLLTSNESNKGK